MELVESGDRAMRRRLRRVSMEGGVTPPGEIGISSPRFPLLNSWSALPSKRNWCLSGLWLSSARSKAARLHHTSGSWREAENIDHLISWRVCKHVYESTTYKLKWHSIYFPVGWRMILFSVLTPSSISITSFKAGPLGERKPELSTTQVVFISPVESGSLLGPPPSFDCWGEKILREPASLGVSVTAAESEVSCRRWQKHENPFGNVQVNKRKALTEMLDPNAHHITMNATGDITLQLWPHWLPSHLQCSFLTQVPVHHAPVTAVLHLCIACIKNLITIVDGLWWGQHACNINLPVCLYWYKQWTLHVP